jgi:hypothetical protein
LNKALVYRILLTLLVVVGLAAFNPQIARAVAIIDFNDLVHGEIPGVAFHAAHGVTVSATNADGNGPDIAVAFDTSVANSTDPDLVGPPVHNWAGGNMPLDTELGRLIIIQENPISPSEQTSGIIANPDDEGARPAGKISFFFDDPRFGVGFDLVDVENVESGGGSFAVFWSGGSALASVAFSDFVAGGTFDQGAVFGDNTLNRIAPIYIAGGFDQLDIVMGGSGGVDNLVLSVPEPTTLALFGLGLLALGAGRRRK